MEVKYPQTWKLKIFMFHYRSSASTMIHRIHWGFSLLCKENQGTFELETDTEMCQNQSMKLHVNTSSAHLRKARIPVLSHTKDPPLPDNSNCMFPKLEAEAILTQTQLHCRSRSWFITEENRDKLMKQEFANSNLG